MVNAFFLHREEHGDAAAQVCLPRPLPGAILASCPLVGSQNGKASLTSYTRQLTFVRWFAGQRKHCSRPLSRSQGWGHRQGLGTRRGGCRPQGAPAAPTGPPRSAPLQRGFSPAGPTPSLSAAHPASRPTPSLAFSDCDPDGGTSERARGEGNRVLFPWVRDLSPLGQREPSRDVCDSRKPRQGVPCAGPHVCLP